MKKNIIRVFIISIMLVLIYSTIVNAYSFNTTLIPSKTSVKAGEELTVTLKVSNLDVGDGINTFSGVISYDQNVFEKISDSSIEGLKGWSKNYNQDNGKVTLTKMSKVKDEEELLQITLKAKSDSSGNGKVSLTNIVASNSQADISSTDISISISVGNSSEAPATNNVTNTSIINAVSTNTSTINATTNKTVITPVTNNSSNSISNSNSQNSKVNNVVNNASRNNAVSSYVNTSSTSSKEDMPYTGVEDTLFYVIIAIVIAAIVFYIKFEKINKEMK